MHVHQFRYQLEYLFQYLVTVFAALVKSDLVVILKLALRQQLPLP
jgi:hypothetical protein